MSSSTDFERQLFDSFPPSVKLELSLFRRKLRFYNDPMTDTMSDLMTDPMADPIINITWCVCV